MQMKVEGVSVSASSVINQRISGRRRIFESEGPAIISLARARMHIQNRALDEIFTE
jgi:hypothetical protein